MNSLKVAAFASCFLMAGSARATLIDVYQGSSFTYKGTVEAYSGTDSAVVNYDYFSHSGHPTEGPNLKFNRGEIFFYDGPEGLTFNAVFNKEKENPTDPDTFGAVSWNIGAFSFPTGDPAVLLSDDKRELKEISPDAFKGRWQWVNNTDGGIIGGLTGDIWGLVIDPVDYQNLDSLKVFSDDGSRLNMNLRTGDRGYMFFVPHVPEAGSTLSFMGAGLGALALCRRKFSK
jgi:hypothetical protein